MIHDVVHKKMKMEKILKRLLYGLIGIIAGFFMGGVLAYLIAFFITPKGQDPSLMFIISFALITSQLGMILGPYFVIRMFERKKNLHNKAMKATS